MKLKDFAEIGIRQERPRGMYYSNGKRAISLAIIKESTSKMADLKSKMSEMINFFRKISTDGI